MRIHHVQLSGPRGCEDVVRSFYGGVLTMTELPKPAALATRGGVWFRRGELELHIGIEEPFAPARKAHPGIAVDDLDAVERALAASGTPVTWDENIPGVRRFHTHDPVGNRLEFQQA